MFIMDEILKSIPCGTLVPTTDEKHWHTRASMTQGLEFMFSVGFSLERVWHMRSASMTPLHEAKLPCSDTTYLFFYYERILLFTSDVHASSAM